MSPLHRTEREFTAQQRLVIGAAVRQRQRELGLSHINAAKRLNMGYSTYCALQAGFPKVTIYTRHIRMKVAMGYGWVSNWPEVIVKGNDPMYRKTEADGSHPRLEAPKAEVKPEPITSPEVPQIALPTVDASTITASLSTAILAVLNGDTKGASMLVAHALQQMNVTPPLVTPPTFPTPAPRAQRGSGPWNPVLTGDRLEQFNAEAVAGVKPIVDLAAEYGIAVSTAQRYSAKARGTWQTSKKSRKRRTASAPVNRGGRPPALTGSKLARFTSEALARKKTISELAKEYGVTEATAYAYTTRIRKEQEQSATEIVVPTLV